MRIIRVPQPLAARTGTFTAILCLSDQLKFLRLNAVQDH